MFGSRVIASGSQTTQRPGRAAGGLVAASNQPVAKPAATARTRGIGLTTVSNQSVVKLPWIPAWPTAGLTTVSNQSVVKLLQGVLDLFLSLTTVSNQSVVKPMRANPQTRCRIGPLNRMIKRQYSCFSDPGRKISRPMWISAGVNSHSNSGTACFSSQNICYPVGSICG